MLEGLCNELDVPLLAARGYPSASVLREFAVGRLRRAQRRTSAEPLVLHLGDHDPSGIDMTRDLTDRIGLFNPYGFELRRIALNMDQIEEKQPPPNPAKTTDARSDGYIARFGHESWELDALEPSYLVDLVRTHISADLARAPGVHRSDQGEARRRRAQLGGRVVSDFERGCIFGLLIGAMLGMAVMAWGLS